MGSLCLGALGSWPGSLTERRKIWGADGWVS